jgi:acyl carrier protein
MPSIAVTPGAIRDQVRSFLLESFLTERTGDPLGDDDELIAVLDSLQLLRTVIQLEATFGISVGNSELTLDNLGTLRRIGTFVDRKLNT